LAAIPTIIQNIQGCDSVSLHGNKYYNSQTVIDTLSGIYCDSVVNTILTINEANAGADVISAWCSHTWIDGNDYYLSNNTATHTLINQGGCDSIVTLNLTVTSVDTSVNLYNSTFVSNASNATYQWVNCTQGYAPIPNATGKTFNPVQNGNYAVIVTENACTDTSACIFLTNVGIEDNFSSRFEIYPNPFNDNLTVESLDFTNYTISILNVEGKVIKFESITNSQRVLLSTAELQRGIYFIKIDTDNQQFVSKIIKQ
jgi:hypothetical protein